MSKFTIRNGESEVTGDFSGLEKFIKELGTNYYSDIGFFGGEPHDNSDDNIPTIAAKHEFGVISQGLPERSMLRMPLSKHNEKIRRQAENQFAKDPLNIRRVFQIIGVAGEATVKEAFITSGFGKWKPLSENYKIRPSGKEVTPASKPLIDTGILQNAVTSKVGQ